MLQYFHMSLLDVWEQLPALSVPPVLSNTVSSLLALEHLHNPLQMASGQAQEFA